MSDLRQKLLTDLFREFRNEDFYKGTGSYKPGRRLSPKARIIDRIYKTVEKYIELEYTENIIDYYTRLHIMPYEESQKQCHKDGKNKKIIEQRKKNLKFIEENGLVEHPKLKGFYGTKEGRVFSSKAAFGAIRELKPVLNKCNNGYYMLACGFEEDGKKIQISWHVFIAQIFIPNPQNLPEVNHLDENKGNCRADNLEWSTRLDNVRHSAVNWGRDYIVENTKTGEIYEIRNLSKWCAENGVNKRCAYNVINGIQKAAKGYLIKKLDITS
tara:strand:+ start:264 stop:1073 length:810 start_codon:yes stop_codon:yes gene_type:complete